LVNAALFSFAQRSRPWIKTYFETTVKRQPGKMAVPAAQVKGWRGKFDVPVKSGFDRA